MKLTRRQMLKGLGLLGVTPLLGGLWSNLETQNLNALDFKKLLSLLYVELIANQGYFVLMLHVRVKGSEDLSTWLRLEVLTKDTSDEEFVSSIQGMLNYIKGWWIQIGQLPLEAWNPETRAWEGVMLRTVIDAPEIQPSPTKTCLF